MFQEFYFLPVSYNKARTDAFYIAVSYLGPLLLAFVLVFTFELNFPAEVSNLHIMMAIIFVVLSIRAIAGSRKSVTNTRIFLSPDAVQLQKKSAEMKIPLTDISKVECYDGNTVIIYSTAGGKRPALMIAGLDKQDELLAQLGRYAPVSTTEKLPLQLNPVYRRLFSFFLLFLLFIHLFFHNPFVVLATAAIIIGYYCYIFILWFLFRSQYSGPASLVSSVFLVLVILLRCGLLLLQLMRR